MEVECSPVIGNSFPVDYTREEVFTIFFVLSSENAKWKKWPNMNRCRHTPTVSGFTGPGKREVTCTFRQSSANLGQYLYFQVGLSFFIQKLTARMCTFCLGGKKKTKLTFLLEYTHIIQSTEWTFLYTII